MWGGVLGGGFYLERHGVDPVVLNGEVDPLAAFVEAFASVVFA